MCLVLDQVKATGFCAVYSQVQICLQEKDVKSAKENLKDVQAGMLGFWKS